MQVRHPPGPSTPSSSINIDNATHVQAPLFWTVSVSKPSVSGQRTQERLQRPAERSPGELASEIFGGQLDGMQDKKITAEPQAHLADVPEPSFTPSAPIMWVFHRDH